MNFVQTLRKRSELQPGVPALVDRCLSGDRVLTYSGLNRLVDYLSFELREKKVAAGDRVLIGIGPSQEMYVYLLAALQIGAIPILCDPAAPHDEFISWISALEPKACIVPTRGWVGSHFDAVLRKIPSKIFVGHVRSQARWLRLGKLGALEEQPPESAALISLVREASNRLAFRVWSQDQLRQSVQLLVTQLKLKAGEIDLCASALHLLGNLAAGLTSVIGSRSERNLDRQVDKFKPTRTAARSPVVRRLLRKPFSPFHRVFITDAPLEPEEIDYFTGRMQHANIELIFYDDLPLASIPLKEYERVGDATLVGNFYATVEARISLLEPTGKPSAESADLPVNSKPDEIGELFVRGSFLPNRLTLDALLKEGYLAQNKANGHWCSTGVVGYLDLQSRFWLTGRKIHLG
jgi:acyl-CoA synthetase (AMP-forming)/AMP-acid ligase II